MCSEFIDCDGRFTAFKHQDIRGVKYRHEF